MVVAAGNHGSAESARAISSLCSIYWYPLYAYIRSRGYQAAEAEDLTQAFLLRLLDKNALSLADREKGRFRSFLLTALKNYLANELEREHAKKRGGGKIRIGLDFHDGERRFSAEPVDQLTPERVYERRWALTLMEQVLTSLREDYHASGRGEQFEKLKVFLNSAANLPSHETIARELRTSPGAVKTAVHRLRRRFRELLRERIAQTVSKPEEIDDEVQDLFDALRND